MLSTPLIVYPKKNLTISTSSYCLEVSCDPEKSAKHFNSNSLVGLYTGILCTFLRKDNFKNESLSGLFYDLYSIRAERHGVAVGATFAFIITPAERRPLPGSSA